MQKHLLLPLFLSIGLILQGCDSKEVAQAEPPPAKVSVLSIQPQSVNFSENLPARVHAFRTAEIRPQVGGIIEKVLFKQGSEVRAGQALYKINSETFEADVNSNRASLNKAEAEVARLKVQLERYEQLLPSNAISKQEVSNAQAQYRQALADVAQMKALLARQNLNLQYATVRAPISGRIGQSFVTEGALVGQGDTNTMATIQQIDKVYVDVKQSVSEYERLQAALQSGELSANSDKTVRITNSHGQPYNVTAKCCLKILMLTRKRAMSHSVLKLITLNENYFRACMCVSILIVLLFLKRYWFRRKRSNVISVASLRYMSSMPKGQRKFVLSKLDSNMSSSISLTKA